MKLVLAAAVLLLLGCNVPGVGELKERVDALESGSSFDGSEILNRLVSVEERIVSLDEKMSSLETGYQHIPSTAEQGSRTGDLPEPVTVPASVGVGEVEGLEEQLDAMSASIYEDMLTIMEDIDGMVVMIDSLAMDNDSLRAELEELQETVQALSGTVSTLRASGTASSTGSGGTVSGSTVRGGSSGSGGSTGTGGSGSR